MAAARKEARAQQALRQPRLQPRPVPAYPHHIILQVPAQISVVLQALLRITHVTGPETADTQEEAIWADTATTATDTAAIMAMGIGPLGR